MNQKYNKKVNSVASDNAIQVEELKLRKMKMSRITDFDQFFDECVKLVNDDAYDKYYRLTSMSYLLKDVLPGFALKRKEDKKSKEEKVPVEDKREELFD